MANLNITNSRMYRDNSGTSPSAHSLGLYAPYNQPAGTNDSFMFNLIKRKDVSIPEKAVIELLYLYGLRISEVLKILPTDVAPTGQIFIKTSKTGEPRIVVPVEYTNFWANTGRLSLPLSNIYSRFYFYRLFKKLGYYSKYGNNDKYSVTHYFRHELVRNLEANGFDRKAIAQFLAHRGLKSIGYYEK